MRSEKNQAQKTSQPSTSTVETIAARAKAAVGLLLVADALPLAIVPSTREVAIGAAAMSTANSTSRPCQGT